jgi:L-lactate dehydrogenase complex protein LldG
MAESAARAAILAALPRGVGDVDRERDALPRAATAPVAARLELLTERLEDYGVVVRRVTASMLAGRLATDLAARGVRRLVVPAGFPAAWLDALVGIERLDADAALADLDAADAVVTLSAVAAAQTGTIALDAGVGQGRRAASLIPDLHVCIVREGDVVASVPELVARLAPAVRAGRPITLISGPSATSDIELVRVAGVHGPRSSWVYLLVD